MAMHWKPSIKITNFYFFFSLISNGWKPSNYFIFNCFILFFDEILPLKIKVWWTMSSLGHQINHSIFAPLSTKTINEWNKILNPLGLRLLQLIKHKGFLKGYHQRSYWNHSTMQYYHIVHKLGTSCLMRPPLVSKLAFEIPLSGHWRSHWGFAQSTLLNIPRHQILRPYSC